VYADRLIELGRTELPELQALGCLWAGFTASALGELGRARALLEQGAAAPADAGVMTEHDNHRVIASQLALILTACGDLHHAREHAERALVLGREAGRPGDLAHAWLLETERCVVLGDTRAGRAAAATVTALATDNDFVSFLAFGRFYEAFFDEAQPCAERIAAMRAALAERRCLGDRWHESMLLGLIAAVQLAAGDVSGALESVDLADAHVARTSEGHYQAELQRLRGECARAAGRSAEAANWFRRAAETAREQGARLFEQRAASSLARVE
jgi:tetratricopeptide (TPR) repeat protein